MPGMRTETDSFGPIEVPEAALWGAQTARSLHFFAIGEQRMPLPVIHALAWVKWAAASVNGELNLLDLLHSSLMCVPSHRTHWRISLSCTCGDERSSKWHQMISKGLPLQCHISSLFKDST